MKVSRFNWQIQLKKFQQEINATQDGVLQFTYIFWNVQRLLGAL